MMYVYRVSHITVRDAVVGGFDGRDAAERGRDSQRAALWSNLSDERGLQGLATHLCLFQHRLVTRLMLPALLPLLLVR